MSIRMLAAATIVAIGSIGGTAAAAGARPSFAEGAVTSLSVVPTSGRSDVLVGVNGDIAVKHFTLSKPNRIVVDISGATLGLPAGATYDGVARGAITKITYSQFSKNVVRIVLTLNTSPEYTVAPDGKFVRVSVSGAREDFESWQLGAADASAMPNKTEAAPKNEAEPKTEAAPKNEPAPKTEAAAVQAGTPRQPTAETPAEQPKADAKVEAKRPEPKAEEPDQANTSLRREPRREPQIEPVANRRQQPSRQPRISVTYDGASITDVLASFSASFNRTILPSKTVTGTVTAHIIDQPWDVALRAIMNANGFDVTEDASGIIYVDTFEHIAERQATVPLSTRTFRLNYTKATMIAPMVRERLTRNCPTSSSQATASGLTAPAGAVGAASMPGLILPAVGATQNCPIRGAVTADSITNSLSITDVPASLASLEEYSKSLDLRQPQVNIKAKIILIDKTQLEGLGLRYDLGTQRQFFSDIVPRLDSAGTPLPSQILLGGNTISAIANAAQRVPGAALQLVYSAALGNYDITTFLEAMQQSSLLDVQAEPSVSVLNNRTANLTAGTQVPIRVIDAGSASGNTATAPRANVTFQQTGVIVTVTPQITNNRQIQMKVHVENSDVQFSANDVGAVFPTQKVDNEMLVADGETAVMGGLTQTTVRVTKSGIPILVDLPIIGRLFGVTNRQETKRDLLILITPHIIDEGATQPPAAAQPPDASRP